MLWGMGNIIEQIIDNRISSAEILKREIGIVTELLSDGLKAKVRVNKLILTFLNKCGEELAVGDEVEIHYWTNIGNGYIAVKHGKLTPLGTNAKVENAIITYSGSTDFSFVENLNTLTLTNRTLTGYTHQNGYIVANGYAATYIPSSVFKNINVRKTYEEFLSEIGDNFCYKQVEILEYDDIHSHLSEGYVRPITYSIGLNDLKYENQQYKYSICIKVSDPYYTESNTSTAYSPQNYTFITSNEIISNTTSLDGASILLTFPDVYQQYPQGTLDTIFLDVLLVDIEMVLKIGDSYYYKYRYTDETYPYITIAVKNQAEIDYIMAKRNVTDNFVIE